jgi:outer membrane protein TolC
VYALALARYRQGIDSFLNVLDAQYVWFSAQQDAIAVSKAQLANQVNLYKALGGGQVTLAPAQDAAAYIDTSQHAQHAVTDNSSILVIDTNHP